MRHGFLYICVSVGGAAVLAVEILGTRILGPFYGVSLFLWSALITVTLAALSVGYALGGWWADRGATIQRLCSLLACAGVWLLVVPWLRLPILWVAEPFGLRFAVLVAAFILFFPPLLLLGMVSPYAIKLKTASLGEVGRSAGNLYAVSTLASVVAALATGFFLIPNFGVTQLTLGIGLLLIVTGSIGFARMFKTKASYVLPAVLLLIGVGGILTASGEIADPERGLLTVRQSPYAEIRVVDVDDTRYLLIDGAVHTSVETSGWEECLAYVNVMDIARRFFEKPGDLLLVGLGGGSVVKHYARHGWTIDAVEIDPVVTEMAYRYFGLDSAEARVYHMDGRRFLLAQDKLYDIIMLDAFGSSSIPFHLVTSEALGLIRSRLRPGGILAMNVEAVGWHDVIVRSLAATARRQFEHVTVLPIAEPPTQIGNLVILASRRALALDEELPVPMDRFSPEYDRAHAWNNRFAADTAGAPVLTDELNPVDVWSERVNLAARKELHVFFDEQGIAW
ncbi:MAG TPA: fused MFS/spermidine synthase [Acidobacteriota bacterium]|nr:fused MFS/spermidine synthase [Acidobacteriota bacterium]